MSRVTSTAWMFFWLCFFRLAAIGRTTLEVVAISETIASLVPQFQTNLERPIDDCDRWATNLSPMAFGSSCLHRATAGKVWLAMAGIDSDIAVGFRKRETIEGHAWLEIKESNGTRLLFGQPLDGFHRVEFS